MEAMNIAGGSYGQLAYQLAGSPPVTTVHRTFETPSIEPTLDGYAGFCTNSRAQFDAFLHLIERTDLLGDEQLAMFGGRQQRWAEWNEAVHAWTTQHSTAEVVKLAAELRIPVAPVLNGDTVLDCEHFVAAQRVRRRPDRHVQDATTGMAARRRRPSAAAAVTSPRRARRPGRDARSRRDPRRRSASVACPSTASGSST